MAQVDWPGQPGCVHMRHQAVVHLDSRTIRGGMRDAYSKEKNQMPYAVFERWPWAFLNFTFDFEHGCWPLYDEQATPTPVTLATAAGGAGPIGDPRPGATGDMRPVAYAGLVRAAAPAWRPRAASWARDFSRGNISGAMPRVG